MGFNLQLAPVTRGQTRAGKQVTETLRKTGRVWRLVCNNLFCTKNSLGIRQKLIQAQKPRRILLRHLIDFSLRETLLAQSFEK